jgi:hypothetical protein
MDDCSGSLTAFGVVPFLLAANAESLGDGTITGNALCTVDGLRTAALALMEPLPSPRTVFVCLGMSKVESQHKNLYTSLARARERKRRKNDIPQEKWIKWIKPTQPCFHRQLPR